MAVYVDDMRAGYRSMIMCHMVADTDEELHAMADRIGIQRKWHQNPATMNVSSSHYDIALSKRTLAVRAGAQQITWKQCACMCARRRITGELGAPEEAVQWYQDYQDAKKRAEA